MADSLNYLLFNNPISQSLISTTKKGLNVFVKSNSTASTSKAIVNAMAPAGVMSLYKQGGKSSSIFLRLAGLSGMSAVILGAYGAHVPFKSSEGTRDLKAVFETANRYHFIHSVALMAVPLTKRPYLTGSLMLTGVVLFSGTCYYSSLYNDQRFNKLAPIGGVALILAWASIMFF
ncbi:unnamed protein product [Diamesa serratosioi]